MKGLVKAFDDLPFLLKFILALPVLDGLAWGIYRVAKGLDKNDTVMVIVGLIWIFAGAAIFWIIDLVTLLLYKKVMVFA